MLDKLKQFIMVDNDTLPHVLEKLCLLVMSLPANHLSIASVFAAVQVMIQIINVFFIDDDALSSS